VKMADVRQSESERVRFNPGYVVDTVFGKLRVLQLLFSLVSGATGSGIDLVNRDCSGIQYQFHSFVSWVIFINVTVLLIFHLLNVDSRMPSVLHQTKVHLVLCGVAVLVLFLSSSLAAVYSWCGWREHQKGLAITSALFGFLCVVAFMVEGFFHATEFRKRSEPSSTTPPAT